MQLLVATALRVAIAVACVAAARAQTPPSPPEPAPAPTPAPAPAVPIPAPAPAAPRATLPATPAETLAPVEITGSRGDEVDERRRSTAAKIIVGRDEIEKFGDSTLGEVLRRLPGVTLGGRPGRGGPIRMRGLGGGYTQILLDGERVPPGFSLDSLPPDQVERIEILRAPTAETGARAIAGTINIVLREGYRRRVNDLRLGATLDDARLQNGLSWTRNWGLGDWTANTSLSVFRFDRGDETDGRTTQRRLDDDALVLAQDSEGRFRVRGAGLNGTGRLQWRSGQAGGDTVTLTPFLFLNRFRNAGEGSLSQSVGSEPPPYDTLASRGRDETTIGRLNAQWNTRLGRDTRLELRSGIGLRANRSESVRREAIGGNLSRTLDEERDARDRTFTASAKAIRSLFDGHSLVAGVELEGERLADTRRTLQNGVPILGEFDEQLNARTTRLAAYAQDEWNITPGWAAHAGLRWEGIATRGTAAADSAPPKNTSSVWTPLLHTTWKPDPQSRDQLRVSLTRSYKSPTLGQLIARPAVNTRFPVPGPNTPTQADRAGNPDLKPELATGIDVAVERYLPGSGILSANVFHRRIEDYIRSVTQLETVPYASSPRYVSRWRNVGDATTSGLELEAKFRASDLVAAAPRVDVRLNGSFYRSRVKDVPGPDNRLDQQADFSINAGADYRFTGWPVSLGGNVNWLPGYTTRLSDVQTATTSRKVVVDVYALWVVNPGLSLRFSAGNLAALDYTTSGSVDGPNIDGVPVRETTTSSGSTHVTWQLRLEMKL